MRQVSVFFEVEFLRNDVRGCLNNLSSWVQDQNVRSLYSVYCALQSKVLCKGNCVQYSVPNAVYYTDLCKVYYKVCSKG